MKVFSINMSSLEEVFKHVATKMKDECDGTTQHLITKLQRCFPKHEVMTTFTVVYPLFWAMNPQEVKDHFHVHLSVLKATLQGG
jgi:hypothetical protein